MRALLVVALTTSTAVADPTLDKIEAVYAAAKQVQGDFTKNVFNKAYGRNTPTQGKFFAERPDKVAFDFVDKKKKKTRSYKFDGKTGWEIEHQNFKVREAAISAADLPAAISFLTGAKGALAKTHKVKASANSVTLTPLKPQAAYATLELQFDPATFKVTKSIISATGGDVTTFEFPTVNLDAKLTPDTFTFDPKKFPSYQLIKLAPPVAPPAPPAAKPVAKP